MDNDPKSTADAVSHMQALRGERKAFSLPDSQPATAPTQTQEAPRAVEPPPVQPPYVPATPPLTPMAQTPGNPPAYIQQPPAMPMPQAMPPPMMLNQQQMMQLASAGFPLNQQQMQWLQMGYPPQQVLSPQQQMVLAAPPAFQSPPAFQPGYQYPPQAMAPPQPAGPSLYQQFESTVKDAKVNSFDYIDQKKTSIQFGIIGIGQGGSRIAEAFHQLGYPTCVINTASHDLQNINIPDEKKLLLSVGAGGAGKDLNEGLDAAKDYAEDILDLMKSTFPRTVEHILVCCGGGGGSGSGGLPKVIEMARLMNVPVGVIYTLPKDSEGSKVKQNAFNRLRILDNKVASSEISPLILIDNNRIHEMHTGVSLAKFWRIANAQVAGLFHLFNVLSAQNSAYASFDPADYQTIIKSKGCMIFGMTSVDDPTRPSAVSKALRENVGKGLLAEGFHLNESKIAGMIVTGSQELMESLPQENVDAATECLERMVGGGTLHHGIYVENVEKLTVYTIIGGLPLPEERVNRLLTQAASVA